MYLVRWRGRKINSKIHVISLRIHQNIFSPKWRENWVKINFFLIHIPLFIYLFSSLLTDGINVAFLFCFFIFSGQRCLFSFFLFFFFSFDFLGLIVACFFFSFKDLIFILGHDFYFFVINLDNCFFFFFFSYLSLLIGHHSLTNVYE